MKILGLDPGQSSDPFAIVLIDVIGKDIHILGCKFYLNQEYHEVESDIARIYKENGIKCVIIERNSMGKPVYESLKRQYGLQIKPIFTMNKTRNGKDDIMDKGEMVAWIIKMEQEGRIHWPPSKSEYMKELIRQWRIFGEYKKDKYEAPQGEHDDLFMALMIACFYARTMIEYGQNIEISSRKVHWNETPIPDTDIGTGLSMWQIPTGQMDVRM